MKRIIAAMTTALLAVGVAVVGVAAPASASPAPVHNITSTCAALTVDLSGYADIVPAVAAVYHDWTETIVDVPGQPEVLPVTYTEDLYWHLNWDFSVDYGWFKTHPVWGWTKVWPHQSRTVTIPGKPAVPAVTHTIDHHDLVSAAQPEKNNTVVVTIDGAQKASKCRS